MQTPGGVEDDHAVVVRAGVGHRVRGDVDRVGSWRLCVYRKIQLLTERLKLVYSRGAIDVGGHEQGALVGASQLQRELGGGGRLARALQTNHHDHGRWGPGHVETGGLAQQLNKLLVHDSDHLLRGAEALEHFLPDCALTHPVHERFDYLEVDVGLEQGTTHLFHSFIDIRLV